MLSMYSDVVQEDRGMKQLIARMPALSKSDAVYSAETPAHTIQQRAVLSLSFAHKVYLPLSKFALPKLPDIIQFYSLHRHFQILSLKDPWFTCTKVKGHRLIGRVLEANHSQISWLSIMRHYFDQLPLIT